MINAPKSDVKPEQELAQLTLMSSTTEEQVRRRSTLRGVRPSLGEINGEPIIGPLPPMSSEPFESDIEMIEHPVDGAEHSISQDNDAGADDSSSVTLIDAPLQGQADDYMESTDDLREMQQGILEDKENLPPTKEDSTRPMTPENDAAPLSDASPSRANRQARALSPVQEDEINGDNIKMQDGPTPPARPPPVPPRPDAKPEVSIQEQLEIGAQQDVTEVIGNVLFQLQCAIKPEEYDKNGEQIDKVKNLFYGKLKSNTTDQAGKERTSEAFFSDIKVNVFSEPPPSDIYAALDGAFDEQDVEVAGTIEPQYTTISRLPLILQIHVNRTNFDREKQTNIKSNHLFNFEDKLYIDRYTDLTESDLVERRTQKWAWKKQLSELEADKTIMETDVCENLANLRGLLAQINGPNDKNPIEVPQDLSDRLEAEELRLKGDIEGMLQCVFTKKCLRTNSPPAKSSQIKDLQTSISTQFIDQRKKCYRLHSVFIHRGGASSGHYWIYIHDFERKIWRKYNDGYVTKVEASEVFGRDSLIPPATPYFLTYVMDGLQNQIIDCVRREPIEPPPAYSAEDVVMEDVMPSIELEDTQISNAVVAYQNNDEGYQSEDERTYADHKEYVPVTEWDDTGSQRMANW